MRQWNTKQKLFAAVTGLTALAAGAAVLRSNYERRALTLRSYQIRDGRIDHSLRLAFLTDLHGNQFGTDNEQLIQAILDARPDAVLMGGDMMVVKTYRSMDFSALEQLLQALSGRFSIYYAEGNHELRMYLEEENYPGWWEAFVRLLDRYQVRYLQDETVQLTDRVTVSGLIIEPDYYTKLRIRKMPGTYLPGHLPEVGRPENYHVVMAHTPQYMEQYWQGGADLVLSGHYHGGTVVLPRLGGLVSPQFRLFPKYARGICQEKGGSSRKGIVSAGLGTHSINVRLMNKPELVVIDLLPEEG